MAGRPRRASCSLSPGAGMARGTRHASGRGSVGSRAAARRQGRRPRAASSPMRPPRRPVGQRHVPGKLVRRQRGPQVVQGKVGQEVGHAWPLLGRVFRKRSFHSVSRSGGPPGARLRPGHPTRRPAETGASGVTRTGTMQSSSVGMISPPRNSPASGWVDCIPDAIQTDRWNGRSVGKWNAKTASPGRSCSRPRSARRARRRSRG